MCCFTHPIEGSYLMSAGYFHTNKFDPIKVAGVSKHYWSNSYNYYHLTRWDGDFIVHVAWNMCNSGHWRQISIL